jgi:hypothetical protein
MDASRIVSIVIGLIAVLLIAVGRRQIRRARRQPPATPWRRRRTSMGWLLVVVGTMTMILAAVIW